ncbi:hypothetical protein niasHT_039014 [Heterodera trifolii]|uniref:Uncharacterized protein n=1 Tax=Heterodera trifolii TaxID=157864 RepID=A0ABD2J536_9BILA
MEDKFKEDLLQYLVSAGKTESASFRLNDQIDALSADHSALKQLFLSLESVIEPFKTQSEVIGLIGTELGWRPVIKLLHALLISGSATADVQLKERALKVLTELIPMSTSSAIGPHLEQMIELALAPIDGGAEGGKAEGQSGDIKAHFEHLTLEQLHEKCPSAELRLSALRALDAIFDKANMALSQSPGKFELMSGVDQFFPRLQHVLLAMLADDRAGEEARNLSNKCMSLVIANHNDPNAIFLVLSDMSADPELMLKDDPLLDDLIEKCWARDNKLQGRSSD